MRRYGWMVSDDIRRMSGIDLMDAINEGASPSSVDSNDRSVIDQKRGKIERKRIRADLDLENDLIEPVIDRLQRRSVVWASLRECIYMQVSM